MRRSGKSTLLAKHAAAFPRRIIVDLVGEFIGKIDGAHECLSLNETFDALSDAAKERRWVVIASITPEETLRLMRAIAPADNPRGGYSLAVDGVLLECGELDTIMPNHKGISSDALAITMRGRHYRVSLVGAALRAVDVHRSVTSQADVLSFFQQHESRDIDYIAQTAGQHVAARLQTLEPFAHVRYLPRLGKASVINGDGTVKAFDPYTGADL